MYYQRYETSLIKDKADFYKSGVKEAATVNKLISLIRRIFMVLDKNTYLYSLGHNNEGYLIEIFGGTLGKELLGRFYWLPKDKVFDIYDIESIQNGYPLVGWKSKTLQYSNFGSLLKIAKAESIFASLVAIL